MTDLSTVLLVEDNPADARLFQVYLDEAALGHELLHAKTLAEAAVHLEQSQVDAVLLDLSLPDSTGLATLESVVSLCPGIPVVVLTGLADEEIGIQALRRGAQDYLVKGTADASALGRVLRYASERTRIQRQRDAALSAQRESEQRYRRFYDDTPGIFFTLSEEGTILAVNSYGARHLGYSVADLEGKPFRELVGSSDADLQALQDCANAPGEAREFLWSVDHADGRRLWLRVKLRSVRFRDTNSLLAVCEDVTQAELQERFLNVVLEHVRDGIVACDSKGYLTYFNRATRVIHGVSDGAERLPPEEWAQRYDLYHADGVTMMSHEDVPLYRALTGEMLRDVELVVAPKNGDKRTVLASGQAMYDGEGNKLGAVVSMHDVTESKQVERQLQQAQKMEAVGQLTGGLAHDFNNLLAIIIGNLQLLERSLPAGNGAENRQLVAAKEAALRGSGLTRKLLAFARNQMLEPRLLEVSEVIHGMEELLAATVGEAITIRVLADDDLWRVRADPGILESSLLNLAINARDAMPEGGTITIRAKNAYLDESYAERYPDVEPGHFLLISVSDTGSGMSADVIDRAMEPFFTTKDVGKGSGLGLSMVYGFTKQSGGHLNLYSEVGRGTVVRVYLPKARSQDQPSVANEAGTADTEPTGDEVILAVEDDDSLRTVTAALLQQLGYTVLLAADGADALRKLAENDAIQLVFSDVVMPGGISGVDLRETIHAQYPNVKVLLTSGYAETDVLDDWELQLGVDVLSKPYTYRELALAVRKLLDESDCSDLGRAAAPGQ